MAEEVLEDEQIDDQPIPWGTDETNGLSRRMALRVATSFNKSRGGKKIKKVRRTPVAVITVGLGEYKIPRPDWYPVLKEYPDYSNLWDDWTDDEIATLRKRLQAGHNSEMLYWVFLVPEYLAAKLDAEITGKPLSAAALAKLESSGSASATKPPKKQEPTMPEEDAKYDIGVFTEADSPDPNTRRFCNRRYQEYGSKVDLTNPVHEMTVRMMVSYELQFMKNQSNMQSDDKRTRTNALNEAEKIRAGYSKCAQDMALLEKQKKIEPENESLDAIILRTHDIRKNWRSMEIQNEMGLRGLFDLLEQAHKTDRDEDGNKPEIKIPEVTPVKPDGKKYNHDAILIEQSDKGIGMVVDG